MARSLLFQAGAIALATCAMLTACDQPKPRDAAAEKPAGPAQTADPLPALPDWATPLMGRGLREVFTADAECIGNTDIVESRYTGGSPGVKIIGWGWDPATKAPVSRVVLVDRDFKIAGAGEGGLDRPDVPTARADVTSGQTGWGAVSPLTSGPVDTYGVIADGKAVCRLGHLEF